MAQSDPVAYAVRHGTTDDNEKHIFRSWTDLPLSDKGVKEAARAAEILLDLKIKAIFASPLRRAYETASIFAEKSGLSIIQDRRLMGWKTGVFEGLFEDEVEDSFELFLEHSDVAPPLGTSLDDFEMQCGEFLDEILPLAEKEGPFAFFTHNSNITAFDNLILGKRQTHPVGVQTEVPGGIMAIYADGDDYRMESITKDAIAGKFA